MRYTIHLLIIGGLIVIGIGMMSIGFWSRNDKLAGKGAIISIAGGLLFMTAD